MQTVWTSVHKGRAKLVDLTRIRTRSQKSTDRPERSRANCPSLGSHSSTLWPLLLLPSKLLSKKSKIMKEYYKPLTQLEKTKYRNRYNNCSNRFMSFHVCCIFCLFCFSSWTVMCCESLNGELGSVSGRELHRGLPVSLYTLAGWNRPQPACRFTKYQGQNEKLENCAMPGGTRTMVHTLRRMRMRNIRVIRLCGSENTHDRPRGQKSDCVEMRLT